MKLLAIDTSTHACSVALGLDGEITEDHRIAPREHTRLLLPMISALLRKASVSLADLDAIVLGNGPGSFIGMRIGASVAQGLCHGAGLQLIPVSSLAAVAAEAIVEHGASDVVVAQDARMHEVYVGVYRIGADGLPQAALDEQILSVAALPLADGCYQGAGDGWNRYPELCTANERMLATVLPVPFPRARYLLDIGAASGTAIPPAELVPAYLRTTVAVNKAQ